MTTSRPFVVVSGLIGVGKTTLCERMAAATGLTVHHESAETNPYLEDFYRDPRTFSFPTQVHFLNTRLRQHKAILAKERGGIQDRSIYEDPLFAAVQHEMGSMTDRDHDTYTDLFGNMTDNLPLPDAIVYLFAPATTCLLRIVKRARPCEMEMSIDYLLKLAARYEAYARDMARRTLVIRVDWTAFGDARTLWTDYVHSNLLTNGGARLTHVVAGATIART